MEVIHISTNALFGNHLLYIYIYMEVNYISTNALFGNHLIYIYIYRFGSNYVTLVLNHFLQSTNS